MVQAPTQQRTHAETPVIDALKRAQANAVIMYLNYKRYHWYTFGPLFRDVHKLFDEHAAASIAEVDPVGERVRMLGGSPLSTPDEISANASVAIAQGEPKTRSMIEQALDNEERAIGDLRGGAQAAEHTQDYASIDLFSGLLHQHEKQAWFLREILRTDDGLVS